MSTGGNHSARLAGLKKGSRSNRSPKRLKRSNGSLKEEELTHYINIKSKTDQVEVSASLKMFEF